MGINFINDVAWGSHLCMFYKGRQELADGLVPYFKAGLENNEFCVWALPDAFDPEAARSALSKEIENLGYYIDTGRLNIGNYRDYYIRDGRFSALDMIDWWVRKEREVLGKNFSGIRVAGDGTDLFNSYAFGMNLYEKEVNNIIGRMKVKAVCSYSLDGINTPNILNIIAYHHFTVVNRNSGWEVFKPSEIDNLFA
ncbi:MAG: MEDS domain-containing protein [Candidatus Omnitrophica bacterium]|nr:MEDS domain-containing protein [Candidatus Omnitrophota bacterium]MDD5770740.1 MEDS domain-containing protein [Candidatus Omnitrophota bacterium]